MTDASELTAWWLEVAREDADKCVPKSVEYGSSDLVEMGRTLADIAGREVDDEEATEVGIWFYMLGKVARWTAAIKRGERVSDDTLLDITTYAMMVRRARVTGSWPGVPAPVVPGASFEGGQPVRIPAQYFVPGATGMADAIVVDPDPGWAAGWVTVRPWYEMDEARHASVPVGEVHPAPEEKRKS